MASHLQRLSNLVERINPGAIFRDLALGDF
jgi:hypothetical protein